MENDWIKEVERLRAEVKRLKTELEESDKTIRSLIYDRNFYRDALARRMN